MSTLSTVSSRGRREESRDGGSYSRAHAKWWTRMAVEACPYAVARALIHDGPEQNSSTRDRIH